MNPAQIPGQPEEKTSRLLKPLYRIYERFLKIRGHPREIGLGFALGLFVGMTPVMGLHLVIAVPVAALLKWNKISAGIGVWITNAVTAPFIYSFTYLIGAGLIGIEKNVGLKPQDGLSGLYKLILKAPEIFWAMTVGGIVLGIPLALAGYYFAYSVVHKYQQNIKKKIEKSKQTLARKKKARQIKKLKGRGSKKSSLSAPADGPRPPTGPLKP
jgi:uncharacterized protein (DUF2062 family)